MELLNSLVSTLYLDFVRLISITMPQRIDILGADESAEERSLYLLAQLKAGDITVSDLMGPLFGTPNLTPSVFIPPGEKKDPCSAPNAEFLPSTSASNQLLVEHVHPHDYVNPIVDEPYDLVVIGAGVAGLLSVIVGSWLGKKCALIERHGMGGDCLNTGCVPSKALIACARAAHFVQSSTLADLGISLPQGKIQVDFPRIMERMRSIRAKISHHDSVDRYKRDFCKDVYIGHAEFVGDHDIAVRGDDGSVRTLKFRKAMIATGASPAIPPIAGLQLCPHLTNSNFFNLLTLPPRMLVIGCGPIGLELSQSMQRFGAAVTCLEQGQRLLQREDPDAVDVLEAQLASDGVVIMLGVKIIRINYTPPTSTSTLSTSPPSVCLTAPWGLYRITIEVDGQLQVLEAESLLNATGRAPNVHDCGLEQVGVEWDNKTGVHINEYFATANPDIYACGDCATAFKFTHSADFQARIAIRNMFIGTSHKLTDLLIPWCTYTEPEIAHVGKYEQELDSCGIEYESFVRQLADVDRCICDGISRGFVKITIKTGTDEILGATICGSNAGDMISQLTLCMQYGIGVTQIAGTIHPYPTTQEAVRQACLSYNKYFKDPNAAPLMTLKKVMAEREGEK